MVAYKGTGIELEHIVIFDKDQTIFAAGRELNTHRIKLFLINEQTGNVYSRQARVDSWEELYGYERATVIDDVSAARYTRSIPVYKIKGTQSICHS